MSHVLKERYQQEVMPALMKDAQAEQCNAGAAHEKGSCQYWTG